jgi:hypothetical protein
MKTGIIGLNEGGLQMPTATAGEARIEIDAAPLTVYELVSEITRMGEWSPECYRCEWLDGATTDAIVTAADPGQEFAFTTLYKDGRRA